MKRLTILAMVLFFLLTACSNAVEEQKPWTVDTYDTSVRMDTDLSIVAASYTNVSADVWQWENELWQLSVIITPAFSTAIYVADVTTIVQADTIEDVLNGLDEIGMRDNAEILLRADPYHYVAVSDVQNVVDGWGTREVGPYILPWPENATSTANTWQTDDTTFVVVEGAVLEEATEQIEGMLQLLQEDEVVGANLWYVEGADWQGLAWELMDTFYVSVAQYDDWGMKSIMSVQSDITELEAVTERYGLSELLNALLTSEPLYQS